MGFMLFALMQTLLISARVFGEISWPWILVLSPTIFIGGIFLLLVLSFSIIRQSWFQ